MSQQPLPPARKTNLVVQTIELETMVYDTTTDNAYVLNPTAAAVWRACDGKRSVSDIAAHLSHDTPTTEQTVWYALGQLKELLEEPVAVSRRKFLKMSGAVAASVAIPLVVKMVAPGAASAQSATGVTCCFYQCDIGPADECHGPDGCPAKKGCSLVQSSPAPDCGSCSS
jgi:hypothetical protein